jgi:hypothetical protein
MPSTPNWRAVLTSLSSTIPAPQIILVDFEYLAVDFTESFIISGDSLDTAFPDPINS